MTEGALPAALLQLAEHRSELDELRGRIADLEHALEGDPGSDGIPYRPGPAPRWWLLAGVEREEALARLTGWVEEIYRPGFGHLAAKLPACWPDHAFCAYVLDVLAELWSVLWLQDKRTGPMLGGQAEWLTRHMPAAAEAMAQETAGCEHIRSRRPRP